MCLAIMAWAVCWKLEEGVHGKSPKCLGGNLGDFGGILQRTLPNFYELS